MIHCGGFPQQVRSEAKVHMEKRTVDQFLLGRLCKETQQMKLSLLRHLRNVHTNSLKDRSSKFPFD
jgi:hypothetical protein